MDLSKVNSVANKARYFLKANSPVILTAMAVTGVATTAVLAAKGHHKAQIDIMHAESEHGRDLDLTEKARLTWQYYLPPLTVGLTTMACVIGANTVHSKREAALMSAFTLSERAFADYREKVVERMGEAKEARVREDVVQDTLDKNPPTPSQIIVTGKGDVLCMDSYTGRYFRSTHSNIQKAVNELNAQIINDNYASQNDFNYLLGLPRSKFGDEYGWSTDRLLDLTITGGLSEDSEPCLVLNYNVHPNRGYDKFS